MTRRSLSSTQLGPAYLIQSGDCDLTKCALKFLLFLKPIRGTSGNAFLCSSSDARITCNSSKVFLAFRNTGWCVMLKVFLLCFSWIITFSKSASLGIAITRSISLRAIFSLQPLSNSYLSESLHLLSKNSLFEQILLSAWLYGMPFLQ